MESDDDRLTLFQQMKITELQLHARAMASEDPHLLTCYMTPKPHRASAWRSSEDDILSSDSDKNDFDWLLTPPGTPLPTLDLGPRFSNGCSLDTGNHVPLKFPKTELLSTPPWSTSRSVRGNSYVKQAMTSDHAVSKSSGRSLLSKMGSSTIRSNSTLLKTRHSSPGSGKPMMNANDHADDERVAVDGLFSRGRLSNASAVPARRSLSPSNNHPITLVRSSSANDAGSSRRTATIASLSSPNNKRLERSSSNSRASSVRTSPSQSAHLIAQNRWPSRSAISPNDQPFPNTNGSKKGASTNVKVSITERIATVNGLRSKIGDKIMQNLRKVKPASQEVTRAPVQTHSARKPMKPALPSSRSTHSALQSNRSAQKQPKAQRNKPLEAALQRLDSSNNTSSGLRSFMSNISMSSLQSIRCGKKGVVHASPATDSPIGTSSTSSSLRTFMDIASSDLDGLGDGSLSSENPSRSSYASQQDSVPSYSIYTKRRHIHNWLDDGDDADFLHVFEQRLKGCSGAESPLINEMDGTVKLDNMCLDSMPW